MTDRDPSSATSYRAISARLRAWGRWLQVYVDADDLDRIDPQVCQEIVATCEHRILPRCDPLLGRPRDVDGDGRFTVLISGKCAALSDEHGPIEGYVRSADFDGQLAAPFGNRCDLLYLDAGLSPGPHLATILAHEYAHAVLAGRKGFASNGTRVSDGEEAWLDEALAHVVETLHGFSTSNLAHRVAAFRLAPERYGLVIPDYYAMGLMRSPGHRGAAYLFLSWCTARFGPSVLASVAHDERRGVDAIENATGRSFASLFRDWSLAMALDPQGPRPSRVEADGQAHTWTTAGTSFHPIVIIPGTSDVVRIEVEAPEQVELQITIVGSATGRD